MRVVAMTDAVGGADFENEGDDVDGFTGGGEGEPGTNVGHSDSDIDHWTGDIHDGDAVETLRELPSDAVHCAITSPPYYGLRDYEVEGQFGGEDTLAEYVDRMVDVGRELARVLRSDGSWWLNLGDSYASGGEADAFVPKDKMLVPHRVAIALQEDGWIVRNDTTWWKKGGGYPESVDDRLSTETENVFYLTRSPDNSFDLDRIREPYAEQSLARAGRAAHADAKGAGGYPGQSENSMKEGGDEQGGLNDRGKNPGDVFHVTPSSYTGAHFAIMPEELVETPLEATCPPTVCAECGVAYHVVDGQRCGCDTDETQPGIVLDPFCGSGTTCAVAKRLGRRFIGIDLNPEFVSLAQSRCGLDVDDPSSLTDAVQRGFGDFDG